jgi:hypothetical protein
MTRNCTHRHRQVHIPLCLLKKEDSQHLFKESRSMQLWVVHAGA